MRRILRAYFALSPARWRVPATDDHVTQLPLPMWRDGDHRDLFGVRPVTPEHTVSARCSILDVGLKYFLLFIVWMHNRVKLVRPQTRMAGIVSKKLDTFVNLFKEPLGSRGFALSLPASQRVRGVSHQPVKGLARGVLPDQFERHVLDPLL